MIIHRGLILARLKELTALHDREIEFAEHLELKAKIAESLYWLDVMDKMEKNVPEIDYQPHEAKTQYVLNVE